MMVTTRNLNQAAAFIALGGELVSLRDDHPQWHFTVRVHPWMIWYEKHIGILPYRRYAGKRVWLKEQHRRKYGKPVEFRGRKDGFVFNDVVRVVPFTKREREHMKL